MNTAQTTKLTPLNVCYTAVHNAAQGVGATKLRKVVLSRLNFSELIPRHNHIQASLH